MAKAAPRIKAFKEGNPSSKNNGGGTPPYVPNSADRRRAYMLAAGGYPVEKIAEVTGTEGISVPTLYRYYGDILKRASSSTNAKVIRALFNKAIAGDTTAIIFWLKTRAGFKDNTNLQINGKLEIVKRVIGVSEEDV